MAMTEVCIVFLSTILHTSVKEKLADGFQSALPSPVLLPLVSWAQLLMFSGSKCIVTKLTNRCIKPKSNYKQAYHKVLNIDIGIHRTLTLHRKS